MNASANEARSANTREKILDAAEALFVEHGFAATSLRAIATLAEVNLAAANYHFGSKMGLLAAVLHRHIHPVNEERLRRLNALERSDRSLTLKDVLEALFVPLAETMSGSSLPALMGRIYSEPESIIRPIIADEFMELGDRFQSAIARTLPDLPAEELRWRFHFMIGSMIHLCKFQSPIIGESPRITFTQGIEQLITYSMTGLSAPVASTDVAI